MCRTARKAGLEAELRLPRANVIHNPWLTRRLAKTCSQSAMLSIVDRGADTLVAAGTIGMEEAEALKTEARRRAKAGSSSAICPS